MSRHLKGRIILNFNEARNNGVAVASTGPYAKSFALLYAPDRQPHQHRITQFFTGWVLFMMPNQQCRGIEANSI